MCVGVRNVLAVLGRMTEIPNATHERNIAMLYTIAVVLVILRLLGLVTSYTMGGLIHVLLVIAVVVILLRLISGRSAV